MKIETYIDSLVSYAMNKGLALPEDHVVGKPIFIWLSLDPDRGWFEGKIRWNRLFTCVDNIK